MPEPRRRGRGGRRAIRGAVALAVLAGGAGAYAATRPTPARYRTAIAQLGDVTARLAATGTVEPVTRAFVSFPLAGRVASVDVQPGQRVTAGQLLASQDSTSGQTQLAAAQASLAQAQLTEQEAQNGQLAATGSGGGSAAATGSGGGSAAATGSGGGPAAATGSGGGPAAATGLPASAVSALQSGVLSGQRALDAELRNLRAELAATTAACASLVAGRPGSVAPTALPSASPSAEPSSATSPRPRPGSTSTSASASASASPSRSPSPSPSGSASPSPPTRPFSSSPGAGFAGTGGHASGCPAGESAVLRTETTVAASENALFGAENRLQTALTAAAGHSHSAAVTVVAPSAQQLAADQAQVDAATARVAADVQSLGAAALTSPVAGTVAAVTVTPGQSVAAASPLAGVTVLQPTSFEVSFPVPVTELPAVHLGAPATVTPDGSGTTLTAVVNGIALTPDTSGTVASYTVTAALPQGTSVSLRSGASASVSVLTASASRVLTVPASAVHQRGAFSFVQVLAAGQVVPTRVAVGVTGPDLVEIRSGLRAGEQVVLADLAQPLPSLTNPFTARRAINGGGGRPAGRRAAG